MTVLALTWVAFGLLVGLMARAVLPGRSSVGLVHVTALGTLGSFVGGLLGNVLVEYPVLRLHPAGFLGSVAGSLAVLAIVGMMSRRRRLAY